MTALAGGCLCGKVRYRARTDEPGIVACHCSQCRRGSGHVWSGLGTTALEIEGEPVWFRSSDHGERGFCGDCGASLFWRDPATGDTEVSGGSLDTAGGLRLIRHVWTGSKGDYYDIADGLPQFPQGSDA